MDEYNGEGCHSLGKINIEISVHLL
jgi:hypothetical protein